MKILSAIFGSSKNTETIVNGAVSGLDKMMFTKEERAEANQKLSDWYLKYLEATQPQNLARRLIALLIVGLWVFLILLGVAAYAWHGKAADDETTLAMFVFNVLNELVHQPFMMIMGFYFLAHVVRAYTEGTKDK